MTQRNGSRTRDYESPDAICDLITTLFPAVSTCQYRDLFVDERRNVTPSDNQVLPERTPNSQNAIHNENRFTAPEQPAKMMGADFDADSDLSPKCRRRRLHSVTNA